MKVARVVGVALGALCLLTAQAFAGPVSAVAKPTEVFQGEIVELKIPGRGLTAVKGRMGKETIPFYLANGHYTALVGVDVEAKPGLVAVEVAGTTSSGARRDIRLGLKIKAKSFKKESFSVPAEFDELSAEVLERIKRDQEQFARAFMSSTPERLWEAPFLAPVHSDITSPFGYRRVINGTPRSPHTGVDLKAAMGTEVFAPNHGRVVLLGDFFFSGNSLVLDHGGGLYTVYFHLSELIAAAGSSVRKGEVIALAGMTGRVTGPHLHWGARINGARVDPFELINKRVGNSEKASGAHGPLKGAERQDGQQRSLE
jgi:murein DD-endopeptidase MepM/ murein hydrolase activator NlpD